MPSFKSLFATAALAYLANAKTIKITATSDNKFDPDTVEAEKDDVLEFHFEAKNHSVVAGNYDYPCSPLPLDSDQAFFSGFVSSDDGEADQVFRVTVNETTPVPFYSSQGNECADGMVGIINPSDKESLDDYQDAASELSKGVTPGTKLYGGELADNDGDSGDDDSSDDNDDNNDDDDGADSDKTTDDDKDDAAGVIRVPMVGLLCAIGLAFCLA